MSEDIKLPALGEGIDSGDVAKIHVKEGSEVEVDTVLLELETEKALLELPSPVAGRITAVKISEGDTIEVGQSLFDVDTGGSGGDSKTEKEEEQDSEKKEGKEKKEAGNKKEKEKEKSEDRADNEKDSEDDEDKPKKKKPESKQSEKKNKEDEGEEEEKEQKEEEKEESEDTSSKKKPSKEKKEDKETSSEKPESESIAVPAGPGARRLARELGVDLRQVAGTERGGRITLDDVKAYTKQKMTTPSAGPAAGPSAQPEPLPDFTQWGEVETESIPSLRGKIASNLSRAWNAVPLVTQFDEADITELESLRKTQAEFIQKQGGKLTMTVLVLEALVAALKQHPQFNASVDLDEGVIHYKKYYNIGVAVDTPSGLIVPVIKNVDQKSVAELAVELTELSERARNRKVKLEELRGGNISISNLGGIGGTGFTPLVRPPEVAVVGLSRTRMQPVYKDGTFQPRLILPFCVSYDHKVIDGADAARFARTLAERLENFTGTLLQG